MPAILHRPDSAGVEQEAGVDTQLNAEFQELCRSYVQRELTGPAAAERLEAAMEAAAAQGHSIPAGVLINQTKMKAGQPLTEKSPPNQFSGSTEIEIRPEYDPRFTLKNCETKRAGIESERARNKLEPQHTVKEGKTASANDSSSLSSLGFNLGGLIGFLGWFGYIVSTYYTSAPEPSPATMRWGLLGSMLATAVIGLVIENVFDRKLASKG